MGIGLSCGAQFLNNSSELGARPAEFENHELCTTRTLFFAHTYPPLAQPPSWLAPGAGAMAQLENYVDV